MINFALEPYDQVIEEIKALLPLHAAELPSEHEGVKTEPNYDAYRAAAHAGILRIFTARERDALVGYAVYMCGTNLQHRNDRWATSDTFWILPEWRRPRVALKFLDFVETGLKKFGISFVHHMTNERHPAFARLLEARGHLMIGRLYSKRL